MPYKLFSLSALAGGFSTGTIGDWKKYWCSISASLRVHACIGDVMECLAEKTRPQHRWLNAWLTNQLCSCPGFLSHPTKASKSATLDFSQVPVASHQSLLIVMQRGNHGQCLLACRVRELLACEDPSVSFSVNPPLRCLRLPLYQVLFSPHKVQFCYVCFQVSAEKLLCCKQFIEPVVYVIN